MKKYVCFTGHRPSHFPFRFSQKSNEYVKLKAKIKERIIGLIDKGYTNFISGMALGADTLCAEIVLELKEFFDIKLKCLLPCKNQEKLWSKKDRMKYQSILQNCDEVCYAVDGNYVTGCMHLRNKMMIDASDILIAVFYGHNGGTQRTMDYARQTNKTIIIVN